MTRLFALFSVLLILIVGTLNVSDNLEDEYMKYDDYDALSRQLEQLGIHVGEDELKQLFDEGQMDYDQTGISGVLVGLGLGHYDYNTGVWSPTSNQIYAFDIEVFDEENMYSYFLQGVQSIIPDITITDIREDLSGLNEYHDGNRSVSFVCNGHSYSFTLTGMHDWFDFEMLDHMKRVIDAEKCPYKLYCFETNWNCFILFYGPKESADKFKMILP